MNIRYQPEAGRGAGALFNYPCGVIAGQGGKRDLGAFARQVTDQPGQARERCTSMSR